MITAAFDDTKISVDRVYQGDEISKELLQKRMIIPGEHLETFEVSAGEKIAVKVSLEDVPKVCIRVVSGSYYGDFAFGLENRLRRVSAEGLPMSTYVYGRDVDGESRGTQFTS